MLPYSINDLRLIKKRPELNRSGRFFDLDI